MVEVVRAVHDAIHVTTTADMIADTTEAATIAMTTGTTTDHTGDYLSLSAVILRIRSVGKKTINFVLFQKAISITILQRGLQVSVQIAVLFSP